MSLTRKMLKAMGIEDEQADQIIEAHTESTDALKQQRDRYKAEADEAESLRKQLEESKASDSDWEAKYKAEHESFEQYKAEVQGEQSEREKRGLYEALLRECGVDEKRIPSVLKVSDLASVEVEEGKLRNAKELAEQVAEEWADFIATTSKTGAKVPEPPKVEPTRPVPGSLAEALRERANGGA